MLAFRYFGIDWLAMTLTFLALWQIGNRNKIGFLLMMGGNLCWIVIGMMSESLAMMLANVVFFLMNIRAVRKWNASEHARLPAQTSS